MDFFEELFKIDEKEEEENRKNSYDRYKNTPENMSNWINQIKDSTTRLNSTLRIPKTKIVMLDFEHWKILIKDGGEQKSIEKLNNYLNEQLKGFEEGKEMFLKTGIFSNKFDFKKTICNSERSNLGENLYAIYYMSMMVGAHETTEAVFRELIESKESVETIYDGMPLHTEFRVFYDFDKKETVGTSNYWHPKLMTEDKLGEHDYNNYLITKDKMLEEYEAKRHFVIDEVEKFLEGVKGIEGSWSVDIMKNGDDYWLIDMARMDRSSLRDVIDEI